MKKNEKYFVGDTNKKAKEITNGQSEKIRKRAEGYIEDSKKRSSARGKRRKGLLSSMYKLNLVTKDNVYIEFTQSETGQVMKFGTSSQDMMLKKMQTPTLPSLFSSPPPSLLSSPSQEIPSNDTTFLSYLKRLPRINPSHLNGSRRSNTSSIYHNH